jgi:Tfp pilus assembly PilM family ATPase
VLQSFAKWWCQMPGWLGLSIGAQGLTLVELRSLEGAIHQWGTVEWVEPLVDPWADLKRLASEVKALRQRQRIQARRLAMGLPRHLTVEQSLQIAADLPVRDVHAHVAWAASQALQMEWDAVAFDYRFEADDEVPSTHQQDSRTVTWRACPQAMVRAAQEMSRAAGLKLQFLGVEPLPDADPVACHGLLLDGPSATQLGIACEMARQGAQA